LEQVAEKLLAEEVNFHSNRLIDQLEQVAEKLPHWQSK
jgi:hypothetical protein